MIHGDEQRESQPSALKSSPHCHTRFLYTHLILLQRSIKTLLRMSHLTDAYYTPNQYQGLWVILRIDVEENTKLHLEPQQLFGRDFCQIKQKKQHGTRSVKQHWSSKTVRSRFEHVCTKEIRVYMQRRISKQQQKKTIRLVRSGPSRYKHACCCSFDPWFVQSARKNSMCPWIPQYRHNSIFLVWNLECDCLY